MSWFNTAWDDFISFMAKVGSAVFAFIGPLAQSIAVNGGPVLIQVATDAVIAAENTGGTGAQKRDAAISTVTSELVAKGIPVVMNAVNGAIESAVATLQAQQEPPAVPPADVANPPASDPVPLAAPTAAPADSSAPAGSDNSATG